MGEIAKKVKSGTRVAEQVIHKSTMSWSIMASFILNFNYHSIEFQNLIKNYFSFLKPKIEQKLTQFKSYLPSPTEQILLSEKNLPSYENIKKIQKFKSEQFTICTNDYNNLKNKQTVNQFIKSKNGKYYIIDNIISINNIILLFCYQFINISNYCITDSIFFQHIKSSQGFSKDLEILELSEIESNISSYFLENSFILIEIFNHHL